jgi:hypothetical protein
VRALLEAANRNPITVAWVTMWAVVLVCALLVELVR